MFWADLGLNCFKVCQGYQQMIKVATRRERERSGSVVACLTQDRRAAILASLASLHCVHEQDTFMRKELRNLHKIRGAHLQYVNNHYAKFEFKGMNTVGVTDYTN